MFTKTVALFCFQAFLAHAISAQCLNAINSGLGLNLAGNGLGFGNSALGLGAGCGRGCAGVGPAVASGGGFTVTSSSPIAPSGVSVVSEYVVEGPVSVGGQLPVLSAISVDGKLCTGGAAGTSYCCGNGNIGITSEIGNAAATVNNVGIANAGLAAAGLANGIGLGAAGLGLARAGCNGFY